MKEAFTKRDFNYNLRGCRVTFVSDPKTKKYGTDAVIYKAAQILSILLTLYKNLPSSDLL